MTDTHSLRLERTYDAPLAKVRNALTDPKALAKWFAPGPMTAQVHACDARVGGQYEISMHGQDEGGNPTVHTCTGRFTELSPTVVAMTFNWSGEPLPNDTDLRFELAAAKGGTRLVLLHTGFPTKQVAQHHVAGWEGCLAELPNAL